MEVNETRGLVAWVDAGQLQVRPKRLHVGNRWDHPGRGLNIFWPGLAQRSRQFWMNDKAVGSLGLGGVGPQTDLRHSAIEVDIPPLEFSDFRSAKTSPDRQQVGELPALANRSRVALALRCELGQRLALVLPGADHLQFKERPAHGGLQELGDFGTSEAASRMGGPNGFPLNPFQARQRVSVEASSVESPFCEGLEAADVLILGDAGERLTILAKVGEEHLHSHRVQFLKTLGVDAVDHTGNAGFDLMHVPVLAIAGLELGNKSRQMLLEGTKPMLGQRVNDALGSLSGFTLQATTLLQRCILVRVSRRVAPLLGLGVKPGDNPSRTLLLLNLGSFEHGCHVDLTDVGKP